jgi:hypothetical protein
MAAPRVSEEEFIELWRTHRSASIVAKTIDVPASMVHKRRRSIERRRGIVLESDRHTAANFAHLQTAHKHPQRLDLGILNGTIVVFSDAHFWPGIRTTAFKGLLHIIRNMQPQAVVNNGDAFDGASISRFPRIGWDQTPSIIQELKACDAALGEIEECTKKARHNVQLPGAWKS